MVIKFRLMCSCRITFCGRSLKLISHPWGTVRADSHLRGQSPMEVGFIFRDCFSAALDDVLCVSVKTMYHCLIVVFYLPEISDLFLEDRKKKFPFLK